MKHLSTILVSAASICMCASACSDTSDANDRDGAVATDTETPHDGSDDETSAEALSAESSGTSNSPLDASSSEPSGNATDAASASDTGTSDAETFDTGNGQADTSETSAGARSDSDADTSDGGSDLAPVDLGQAVNYVILAKSAISATAGTLIVGDVGLSPADATYITGFGLDAPPTTYSTSDLVTGKIWAPDYDAPTPVNLTEAVLDMEAAYTDAAGRTLPDATELGAGDIDGLTLSPGLYKWGTGVSVSNNVTLEGSSTDVWILQIGQDLLLGSGASVTLSGEARPQNVFWQVAGQATLGTTSSFQGILLSQTLIEFNTGATMTGRAFAQTAVTLDAVTLTGP